MLNKNPALKLGRLKGGRSQQEQREGERESRAAVDGYRWFGWEDKEENVGLVTLVSIEHQQGRRLFLFLAGRMKECGCAGASLMQTGLKRADVQDSAGSAIPPPGRELSPLRCFTPARPLLYITALSFRLTVSCSLPTTGSDCGGHRCWSNTLSNSHHCSSAQACSSFLEVLLRQHQSDVQIELHQVISVLCVTESDETLHHINFWELLVT